MEETLANNPAITRSIIDLFSTLFDPADDTRRAVRATRLISRIENALESVENLDEDRILRRYLNIVQSTLRTNFYQTAEGGGPKPYVSFKLDSTTIDELPLPRPMVEIFVHSPRVEGVHLRGGKVARGGIRWSDRREDFRTEILGLMKAQMTKNAVIVPVGAKGGFVVKRPPATGGREALLEEGIACYRILMCGMLDITDNLKPGKLSYPANVVRRDGDDPYLVVAADKGTATFSDIANGIARDYDFWLDDAFASGGSVGYDHKKMGITARGAWESVKRHFREMGVNTQTTDFTCVGVGDMSGDVFGNGMLLSEHIKLLGAFNHLHIFVDPDPDPAKSFKERKRLFEMPRSSWTDYDAKLISKGGGIFERKAKTIKITPQMRDAFGLTGKETVTPNELIRGMLGAPIDLMWFGGIGTYVKSQDESHAEVGDRVSDALRLDARDLRCKVIGEGANLGITQLGRIEYALTGGRISADFIDNSAGVGSSDHEVNIKILLGEVMAAGKITRPQRDKLLARMTNELAEHVLMDNYRQSMALTHCQVDPLGLLDESIRFMRDLERAGELDRQVEFLPDDETLEERRAAGLGLTRPELAVLLAYAKMTLYDQVLDSEVADDHFLAQDVGLYFPKPLRAKFGDFVPGHRLRREISANYITNSLINRAGPTFINEMRDKTGASPAEITKAYLITRQVFGMHSLWGRIEALDNKIPAETQTTMNMDILRLTKRGTLWMLRNTPQPLDVSQAIRRFEPGIQELVDCLDDRIPPDLREIVSASADGYIDEGVPKDLARQVAGLDTMFSGYDIVRIAAGGGHPVADVARVYFTIGERFGLDWLRGSAESLNTDNEWQVMAVSAIIDDLYAQQMALSSKVVHEAGSDAAANAVIEAWASANDHRVTRAENIVEELKSSGSVDLAMLAVANREIRSLLVR
jgi:glutamate dehydrogenase